MKISVIIPTYKRPRTLLQTLASLQQQTADEFEVLVVDNAAEPAVERAVAEFNETAKVKARYVPEPQLGLHNARHAGARAAGGELLCFTDDDATFDPGCLAAYAQAFAGHPDMAAAGGPVRPVWESPPPDWVMECAKTQPVFGVLSLLDMGGEFFMKKDGIFFGVNMAIRRDALFDVQGFNPESFGDIWLGDGETGLNRKLWNRGWLVGYVPGAVVYHHVPPSRMTVEYFCRRWANEGASEMYAHFHPGLPGRYRMCRHAAWTVKKFWRLWLAARRVQGRTDRDLLQMQMDAARTQQHLKYIVRLLWSQRFRELVLKEGWL
jgi:GT2 family glycosyltransferase